MQLPSQISQDPSEDRGHLPQSVSTAKHAFPVSLLYEKASAYGNQTSYTHHIEWFLV